jgi:hypothetical protein
MSTFQTRIEDKIGSVGDNVLLSDALTEGAKEAINIMPEEALWSVSGNLTDSGAGASLTNTRFLYAHKSGERAIEGDPAMKARYTSATSLHKATDTCPVYWKENQKVFVQGTTAGGTVVGVAYPAVDATDSDIANYPNDVEYIAVLYATIQGRIRQIADKRGEMPTAPVPPSVIATPGALTISATISGTPPDHTALTSTYTPAVVSTMGAISVGALPTAPSYTAPIIGAQGDQDLTKTFTQAGSLVDYYDWFDELGKQIETEKDIALASESLKKIRAFIEAYGVSVQRRTAEFQGELELFRGGVQKIIGQVQADIEEAKTNAQLTTDLNLKNALNALVAEGQAYIAKAQVFMTEVQEYGAKVTAEVQEFQANLARYNSEMSQKLNKFMGQIQNYTAESQSKVAEIRIMESELNSFKENYRNAIQLYKVGTTEHIEEPDKEKR